MLFTIVTTNTDSFVTASSVNFLNGNGIKPLNGINVAAAAAKPVISTNTNDSCNGHAYDESDLVSSSSSSIVKPHNGYVRQCSKSNGCSEFENQSNRLNTYYSQMSAKNGFNHSTVSIISNKKSVNGMAKVGNEFSKTNGNSTSENGFGSDSKPSTNSRVVSNGNGLSNSHVDSVNVDGVTNGNVNGIPKAKTAGKMNGFLY